VTQHKFGTDVNPGLLIEHITGTAPAGRDASPPPRPAPGTHLRVRDAVTTNPLADLVTSDYGYWTYYTTDIPAIQVSGDGVGWSDTIYSSQAQSAAQSAGASLAAFVATKYQPGGLAALDADGDVIDAAGNKVKNTATGTGTGNVSSVNGKVVAVALTAADVSALPNTYAPTWDQVTAKPTTFAPAAHNHPFTDLTGQVSIAQAANAALLWWEDPNTRPTADVNKRVIYLVPGSVQPPAMLANDIWLSSLNQ